MRVEVFAEELENLNIHTLVGVPDSALRQFCDYVNGEGGKKFKHYVPANEGAAVGIAIGSYLATGKPACVYMQNSGLGNAVNPLTSLANEEVYGIPMLFVIGWRGAPGEKDEPQHKFMGKVTESLVDILGMEYSVIDSETSEKEMRNIFEHMRDVFKRNKQYAVLVKKNSFEIEDKGKYENGYALLRENAIEAVIKKLRPEDVVVSTTGKISREVYEQSDRIWGHHRQCFLTVGGMGHAGMIALGLAGELPDKRIYCIEGDGAVFMHMGELAFLAKKNPPNMIHICLNNDAHESVGGMPTGVSGMDFYKIAEACGYSYTACAESEEELERELAYVTGREGISFIEVKVRMDSREDLGRPKESARENRNSFMNYLFEKAEENGGTGYGRSKNK